MRTLYVVQLIGSIKPFLLPFSVMSGCVNVLWLLFQARVEDLQEYVEILKAELEASKKREKARKVSYSDSHNVFKEWLANKRTL